MKQIGYISVPARLTSAQHRWLRHEKTKRRDAGDTEVSIASLIRDAVELLKSQKRKVG